MTEEQSLAQGSLKAEKPPQERYLHKPFPGSSHSWALSICESLPKESLVVDIGSGSGAIGAELGKKGFTNICSVEIDERAQEFTKDIYRRSESSIEAYQGEKFDLVLLLDIIEHLSDPKGYLDALSSYLNNGATLLISVPNIAHWSIRLSLLCGRFEYTERGILDKTHLHFFTKRHLKKMIQELPDYSLEETSASITPLELMFPKWLIENPIYRVGTACRLFGRQVWPELCGFQLLAVVKKHSE